MASEWRFACVTRRRRRQSARCRRRAASPPGRATRLRYVARRSRLHRLVAWMRISLDVEVEMEEAQREAGRHTAGARRGVRGAALKLCDAIFGDAVQPPLDGGRVAHTGACSQAALPPLQLCGRRHVRTYSCAQQPALGAEVVLCFNRSSSSGSERATKALGRRQPW